MEEQKLKVNINSGDGSFIFCIFTSCWITIGDPDLIDALIYFLMK